MSAAIRVLYVDDEPDLLEIGKVFLEQYGDFSVTTALDAIEGFRLLEQENFDAIISDYQMPGMDGIQFLITVRTKFKSIPFILFTGKGREEVVIRALNEGADFYLQKGGEPQSQFAELSNKVRFAVQRQRAENEVSLFRDQLAKSETQLRAALHALEESRDNYVELYEFAPLGYLTLSGKALIDDVNLMATALALSREILDITGITIIENGEPGQGAQFEVIVPKEHTAEVGG